MNTKLIFRLLGILSLLLGFFMLISLPWANPRFGVATDPTLGADRFEKEGFQGLIYSSVICLAIGSLFLMIGRGATGRLFRKEAMAVVGLSWILATLLGALPFVFSGTIRGPSIRVFEESETVFVVASRLKVWQSWVAIDGVEKEELKVLSALTCVGARGLTVQQLRQQTGVADAELRFAELAARKDFAKWLIGPGSGGRLAPADRASNYRLRWVKMGLVDSMFESQSGFSTTGATVLSDLEDPYLVPRCILFWRASTHFLGGLGIIVLFVVILGQGSAGKVLMRAEVPGPTMENGAAKMQHTAWLFAAIYVGLNIVLAAILHLLGLTTFDAICHAFATMATGGFSTYKLFTGPLCQYPGHQRRNTRIHCDRVYDSRRHQLYIACFLLVCRTRQTVGRRGMENIHRNHRGRDRSDCCYWNAGQRFCFLVRCSP